MKDFEHNTFFTDPVYEYVWRVPKTRLLLDTRRKLTTHFITSTYLRTESRRESHSWLNKKLQVLRPGVRARFIIYISDTLSFYYQYLIIEYSNVLHFSFKPSSNVLQTRLNHPKNIIYLNFTFWDSEIRYK